MPAKENSGRASLRANQTMSFLPVSGFRSGANSAKLLAGTKQRFSGFSQPRQCGDDVLRMLVTGGGGIAHASRSVRVSICDRNCHQRHLTTLMMFGMPLALLRSQLISMSVTQPLAY